MSKAKTDDDYIAYDLKTIRTHESYQVITRAISCRGERQRLALAELDRRGLWLSSDQKRQAGLTTSTETQS